MAQQEIDQKIQDVYKRIQTERKFIQASESLRRATGNQDVLRRTDAQIREAHRSLSYFEDTLRELNARKQSLNLSTSGSPTAGPGSPGPRSGDRNRPPGAFTPNNGPYPTSPVPYLVTDVPRHKPYTNLDLIKADTPYTTAKISKMLQTLEFKLQVELQYKKAIAQMAKVYQLDGDKKSRADAESKRVEIDRKIQLLQVALKRYRGLHILDEAAEEEEVTTPAEGERKDNLRKPISGKLSVTIKEARELDHAPLIKRSSKVFNETQVQIKIEGTPRATSHPSRTDRWNEEFEISVDKANEIELALYDKQPGNSDQPTPIGFLWIRISDIVEHLRKQKVENENAGGGWVTAGAMKGDDSGFGGPEGGADGPLNVRGYNGGPGQMQGPGPGPQGPGGALGGPEGVFGWFAVEPVGAIALHINFVKENVRKRPLDAGGLGRQGAVRMRKGEVHEMNGHKFIARQFYQIILCAFCSEFLLKGSGYQCEDCRYTCHKECYPKVVTKCISKSNAETEADEDKINHRIPHRFETFSNMRANWCCHCGYMLPLGRKNAKKCSECDITCHASCTHLVPDFCGMSMETANQLLSQIHDIKSHQRQQAKLPPPIRTQQEDRPPPPPAKPSPPLPDMSRLDIGGGPPPGPPQYGRGGSAAPPPPPGAMPPYSTPKRTTPPSGYPEPPPLRMSTQYDRIPEPSPQAPPDGYPGPPGPGYGARPPRQSVDQYAVPSPKRESAPPLPYPDRTSTIPPPQAPYSPVQPPRAPPPVQQAPVVKKQRKVGLDDFNFLAVLGKGNFGKVMLAEEKRSNGLYAIKVLKKEFIIDNDEVESTRSEKRVFLTAAKERHPFLLGLHSCFQTETRVYFVMEYVSGGDLMLHIQRKQFSLRQAKFYAAEVLLALEYFHQNGIIYRDLKLDNILLTLDGHVKVADYGLCKEEMWFGNTTSTFCGTPEFMAPEILLEQRYGRAVDWWAFGVLTYEMLLGQSPFRGDDEDEIFDAILEDEPLYPITMPRDAVSILQKLLTRDPARRLGSGKTDAEEIKTHAFFKDTNFDDVMNKRIPPPYYPTISNPSDVSNFDSEFTREQPTLTPVHGQLSAQDQNEFTGFSWTAAWAA